MKRCRDCGEVTSLEDFTPAAKNRDGRVSYCRPCMTVRKRAYRDAARGGPPTRRRQERASSDGVKWCPRCRSELPRSAFGRNRSSSDGLTAYCKTCHNDVTRENVKRNWGSTREYHLRRRYGITSAEYDAMVAAQGGVCALCRLREPQHVDHDHVTGKVRGALCSGCNQGLGNFRDDPTALRQAAAYVERHRQQERPVPRWTRLPDHAPRDLPVARSSSSLPRRRSAVERRLAAALAAHHGD